MLIERYLAANFGTNFLISVWRVFFIKRDYAGLDWFFISIFWLLLLVKCFHQIVMIALKICLKASSVLFAVRTAPLGCVCFVFK